MAAAQPTFEGCAYLLAGIEPGNVVGVDRVDPADLDDALSKYVLPAQPRWSPNYLTFNGVDVLVITIEAPREGDPICTLQSAYDKAERGRV